MHSCFASHLINILSLLLEGCASLNHKKRIATFEQTLGLANSKALTDYVNAFENEVLKQKYPSLTTEKAYIQLLSEHPKSIDQMKLYELFRNYDLESYFRSQLWNEIYAPADSIWLENSNYTISYIYLSENKKRTIMTSGSTFKKSMNKDSIIESELRVCAYNRQGKYSKAIESSKSGNPFMEEYFHVKDAVLEISTSLFSNMIKRNKVDVTNYLARRIIAIELSKFINEARTTPIKSNNQK